MYACAAVSRILCQAIYGFGMPLGASVFTSLTFSFLTTAEAPTRSMAPKGFSLLKKIAAVSSGLLSIAAADVKGWQALQASR